MNTEQSLEEMFEQMKSEIEVHKRREEELQKQLAKKDEEITRLGWAESEMQSMGGALCRGCFKRNMLLSFFVGEHLLLAVMLLTGCALPAEAAPAKMAALATMPNTKVRLPAHHLGRHHCDGELVFTSTNFAFNCFANADKNFTVERNMVAKLDRNGVQLLSGAKYHFNVVNHKKDGVKSLFSEWMETTAGIPKAPRSPEDKSLMAEPDQRPEDGDSKIEDEEPEPVAVGTPTGSDRNRGADERRIKAAPENPPSRKLPAITPPLEAITHSGRETLRRDLRGIASELEGSQVVVLLGLLVVVPLMVALFWAIRLLKYKQPWRSWAIYRAFMAAKNAYSDRDSR